MLCPPANDRWHPWPFLRRLYDATLVLNTKPPPRKVVPKGRRWGKKDSFKV